MSRPFTPPKRLSPDFQRVQAYWEGLLRGAAEIPFWDDLDLGALPDLAPRIFLIGAFSKPERFRLEQVGADLTAAIGEEVAGRFLDEVEPRGPIAWLTAQCSATVEAGAPTWCEDAAGQGWRRLILPMWGDGRISMLLGVAEF